jgi:hypothetical protein
LVQLLLVLLVLLVLLALLLALLLVMSRLRQLQAVPHKHSHFRYVVVRLLAFCTWLVARFWFCSLLAV